MWCGVEVTNTHSSRQTEDGNNQDVHLYELMIRNIIADYI